MKNKLLFLSISLLITVTLCSSYLFVKADNQQQPEDICEFCPAVITEINSDIDKQQAIENNSDIVIFSINENGYVKFSDINSIQLRTLYTDLNGIVPAVRINSTEEAQFLGDYLFKKKKKDFFVVVNEPETMDIIKNQYPYVRGVWDATKMPDLTEENAFELSMMAIKEKCQVILLNDHVSREIIYKIQAKSLVTWIKTTENNYDIIDCAIKGCHGIVGNNTKNIKDALSFFSKDTLLRPSYVVGHRGDSTNFQENSIGGVKSAYLKGATHTELDVHLSKDNKIIVMHDPTLNRTTNGQGEIARMNSDEIMQYKLVSNKNAPEEKIPFLSDILNILREPDFKDKVLIIEIKANSPRLVTEISKLLKDYEDVKPRLMFITFSVNLLPNLYNEIPEIPRGALNGASPDDFLNNLSPTCSFIDNGAGSQFAYKEHILKLKKYGYSAWTWTYTELGGILTAINNGVSGLTMNETEVIGKYIKFVDAPDIFKGENVKITATLYDNSTIEMDGIWVDIDDYSGVYACKYNDRDYDFEHSYYSDIIETERPEPPSSTKKRGGCKSEININSIMIYALFIAVSITIIKKHKNKIV